MKMVKIKYTDFYEKTEIKLFDLNFVKTFIRNTWTNVPENVAQRLLLTTQFIDEFAIENTRKALVQIPNTPKQVLKTIAMKRGCALGDLFMLLPIARYIKRIWNCQVHLITSPQYVEICRRFNNAFDMVFPVHNWSKSRYDRILYLDGVLECDHSVTNHQRQMHRISIFEEFLGIKCDVYDFSLFLNDYEIKKAEAILNVTQK